MWALLEPRLWIAGALAVVLATSHVTVYRIGRASVQEKWDAQITQQALETAKLVQAADAKTIALQTSADIVRRAKNAEINRIATDLADALDRLRQRPARPGAGDLPGDPGAGPAPGCSGASLWAEDAVALRREAARADQLRADLTQCQAQYNLARNALK